MVDPATGELITTQLFVAVWGASNYTYAEAEMAECYGCAVLPARPRKPRDKAKVEAGVLLAQRWILAVLRQRTFYDLADLNSAMPGTT